MLDLSPDSSVETEGVVDEDRTVVEVTVGVLTAEEEVESCLSVEETGADVDWATEDETEELTEPQLPASGLHPVPQWPEVAPQYPHWEQHSDLTPS